MKTRYELDPKIYHSNLYYIQPKNFARYQHIKMINQKYKWMYINEPLQYNLNESIFLWKENYNCFLKFYDDLTIFDVEEYALLILDGIHSNKADKGDGCFDGNITLGYLILNYTNWNY